MAHWRERYIETQMKAALKWAPCLVLIGMRQTGKTSLIKRLAKKYLTFDDDALAGTFSRKGAMILQEGPFPLALDEAQKYSPLFNLLKIQIDLKKQPGKFLVTGSVRFSQKKNIRESLTGRTAPFELYPLSVAEAHEQVHSNWIETLLCGPTEKWISQLERKVWATLSIIEQSQKTGGLPGICFKRDGKVRARLFEQHLDTLLGRDIHLLSETKLSFQTLRQLLGLSFGAQGTPTNFASLGREVGLSAPAVRKYLQLFEGLFLLRRMNGIYYAEDQGLANHCTEVLKPTLKAPWYGVLFHELRNQIANHNFGSLLSSYSTRGGAEVPFIITVPKIGTVALTLDIQERPTEKSIGSLGSLSKKVRGKFVGVALHLGKTAFLTHREVLCLPLHWIF